MPQAISTFYHTTNCGRRVGVDRCTGGRIGGCG